MAGYTVAERRKAVELAGLIGADKAAEYLGMNYRTLYNWINYGFTQSDDENAKTRRFSDEERAAAVKLCKEIGTISAAKKLSISTKTLYGWMAQERAQHTQETTPAPTPAVNPADYPVDDQPAANPLKKAIDALAAKIDALTAAVSILSDTITKPRNSLF